MNPIFFWKSQLHYQESVFSIHHCHFQTCLSLRLITTPVCNFHLQSAHIFSMNLHLQTLKNFQHQVRMKPQNSAKKYIDTYILTRTCCKVLDCSFWEPQCHKKIYCVKRRMSPSQRRKYSLEGGIYILVRRC